MTLARGSTPARSDASFGVRSTLAPARGAIASRRRDVGSRFPSGSRLGPLYPSSETRSRARRGDRVHAHATLKRIAGKSGDGVQDITRRPWSDQEKVLNASFVGPEINPSHRTASFCAVTLRDPTSRATPKGEVPCADISI